MATDHSFVFKHLVLQRFSVHIVGRLDSTDFLSSFAYMAFLYFYI